MDPHDLRVILDSGVAVDAEREKLNVADFLKRIAGSIGERQVSLCVIAVAELAHGIYRADTPERRERRRLFLDELKAAVPVYPIAEPVAELVGRIGAECAARIVTIPFDDLPIGACALERGYAVSTRNLRHFSKIPGLAVIPF
jgi:predicted nucleic acid-binding protein